MIELPNIQPINPSLNQPLEYDLSLNQPPEYHPSINHKIKKINSQIKGFQNDINKIKLKEKISDGNKAKINGLIKIIDQFKKRKQEIIKQNPKI